MQKDICLSIVYLLDLKKSINSNSKLLILNYPSNPSGMTYDKDDLKAIYDVAKENNLLVLSDEIYEKLIYDGRTHTSFASFPVAWYSQHLKLGQYPLKSMK